MPIEDKIDNVDADRAKEALKAFVKVFSTPAFGALPKREIELELFEVLRSIGVIDRKATLYTLMTELRVTRSKASQLLFDAEVRKHGSDAAYLDSEVKAAVKATRFAKNGDQFILEIENPLTQAHLRHRLKALGHVTDTSFNTAVVTMSLDAAKDLVIDLIPEGDRGVVRQALVDAGAPDTSLKGILTGALKALGSKVIGEAAEGLADEAPLMIGALLQGAGAAITDGWRRVFGDVDGDE